ncbi:MAG: hypothetical protein Q4E16_04965 [Neisseria sp.]|nr:hypothetical protein [Neisseria sp.]
MAIFSLINRIIQHNLDTQAVLAGYNGLVLGLRIGFWQVHARFQPDGLLQATAKPASALISVSPQAVLKTLQQQECAWQDVSVAGDLALGYAWLGYFASLQIDGDYRDMAATALAKLQTLLPTFAPRADGIKTAREQQELLQEIRALRGELAYLNARLQRLEQDFD